MRTDQDILFEPVTIGALSLKNRIVMSPMTRGFSPGGVPGEDVAAYYSRRAENDVGLILSECSAIDRPTAKTYENSPFFHGEAALVGWRKVIDSVHRAGGKMGPQIWHAGAMPGPEAEWMPEGKIESPSGMVGPDQPWGEAMTDEDIADTIAAFACGAIDAHRLGFDLVEVHGAHGYIIDQFFWQATNLRTDRYGGATLKERSRFAAEVIKAMRDAVGPDFPISMRISQWKQKDYAARLADSPAAMEEWLVPLAEAGVSIFNCSQRRFWQPEFPDVDGENGLNLAGWAKKVTGLPTITVGSIGLTSDIFQSFGGQAAESASLDNLIRRLERGEFDLVAIGRALLGDPYWAQKIREGKYDQLQGFSAEALKTLA